MDSEFLASLPPEELAELAQIRGVRRSKPLAAVRGHVDCKQCGQPAHVGSRGLAPEFCSRRCRRQSIRARGICPCCEKCLARDGKLECASCAEKNSARAIARRARLIGEGFCHKCLIRKPNNGKLTCGDCNLKLGCRIQAIKEQRLACGQCAHCGVRPADTIGRKKNRKPSQSCHVCRAERRATRRKTA